MITQVQKGKNYFYQISLAMLVAMISIVGCKKNEPVGPTPVINEFNPTSGWVGNVITIKGYNFGADVASNIVKFGDKVAVVNSAVVDASTSSAELKVVVPIGATTGKITVTVNNATGTSTTDFTVNTETVYIAGYIARNGKNVAGYWKNNTFVSLSDGTKSAYASSIVVVGNDVYVAGAEASVAKYWKNGVSVNLSGVQNANATGIAVVGNDVYVAGTEIGSTLKNVARYWKNGVLTILSDGTIDEYTGNIVVSGNDIYVLSTTRYTGTSKYWKNGNVVNVATNVNNGTSLFESFLVSMSVIGSDVYVGGSYYDRTTTGSGYNGAYWKNGVLTGLSSGGMRALAIGGGAVHLVGADRIVMNSSGATGLVAKYWRNEAGATLSGSGGEQIADAITVVGNDVYIAGIAAIGYTTSTIYAPRYWKNNIGINVGDGIDDARVTSIVVIP